MERLITTSGFRITTTEGKQLSSTNGLVILLGGVPTDTDVNSTTIQGTCTHNSTITLISNTSCTFSDVQYDRTVQPLNTWSATVLNMTIGDNQITVTCSL